MLGWRLELCIKPAAFILLAVATAVAAVIGGQNIHALGYRISLLQLQSILQPFSWWHFYLMRCFIGGAILHFCYQNKPKKTTLIANMHHHADFVYALS